MNSKRPSTAPRGFVAVCLLVAPLFAGLAGCSDTAEVAPVAPTPVAAAPVANPDADLVQAASIGTTSAPVRVAFELLGKPAVGANVQVRLVMTSTDEVDSMQASIDPPPEIELTDESVFFQVGKSPAGQRHDHKFGLRPKSAGVLLLTATVTVDKDDVSTVAQFALPVIVSAQP